MRDARGPRQQTWKLSVSRGHHSVIVALRTHIDSFTHITYGYHDPTCTLHVLVSFKKRVRRSGITRIFGDINATPSQQRDKEEQLKFMKSHYRDVTDFL